MLLPLYSRAKYEPTITTKPVAAPAFRAIANSVSAESTAPKLLNPAGVFRVSVAVMLFGSPGVGLIYDPSIAHDKVGEKEHTAITSLLRAGLMGGQVAGFVFLSREETELEA